MSNRLPLSREPWIGFEGEELDYLTATGPNRVTAGCYVARGRAAYATVEDGDVVVIRAEEDDSLLAEAHRRNMELEELVFRALGVPAAVRQEQKRDAAAVRLTEQHPDLGRLVIDVAIDHPEQLEALVGGFRDPAQVAQEIANTCQPQITDLAAYRSLLPDERTARVRDAVPIVDSITKHLVDAVAAYVAQHPSGEGQ